MKGLIIKSPWIDLILEGKKTWEIRGSNCKIRGKIALIKSGSGLIFGTVDLVDTKMLGLEDFQQGRKFHCISDTNVLPYPKTYAWILENPVLFDKPIPYQHPQGAVIWVNLENHLNI
jgi:hypothetical protein